MMSIITKNRIRQNDVYFDVTGCDVTGYDVMMPLPMPESVGQVNGIYYSRGHGICVNLSLRLTIYFDIYTQDSTV